MLEGFDRLLAIAPSESHIVPASDPLVMKLYPAPSSQLEVSPCVWMRTPSGPAPSCAGNALATRTPRAISLAAFRIGRQPRGFVLQRARRAPSVPCGSARSALGAELGKTRLSSACPPRSPLVRASASLSTMAAVLRWREYP